AAAIAEGDLDRRSGSIAVDDVINMQYTSGTTGFPKGVMLTSRNIVNNGYQLGAMLGYTPADRLCVCVPLFHCFGCVIGVLGAFTHGACLCVVEAFDPKRVLETVDRERCTALYGVPTMFMPELEVKIVDPATGATRAVGERGELCCRGYNVMKGYYNNPDATRAAIDADGWLHTGDEASVDADGYVRITGRIKDLIIRGGENISPKEIEDRLREHQAVSDVYVYGIPDAFFGEAVAAAVRLRPECRATSAQLIAWCADALAKFKVPKHVRFVSEFPMTASGKIQKFKLREDHQRELAPR